MKNDYFSVRADRYRAYRPGYPAAMIAFLATDLGRNAVAWDCATGNGQAATLLRAHLDTVIASDHSAAQLREAPREGGIHFVQARAEAMPLADHCVDLLTIAQALHWFDFDTFYTEARRVLKPGARIAAWTYRFLAVTPQLGRAIDAAVRRFYHDVVGPYWPPERRWVDEAYRTIPFPFQDVPAPPFEIVVEWTLDGVLGYLSSWSAAQRYVAATGHDPVPQLREELLPLWGDPSSAKRLRWPLEVRVGLNR